MALFPTHALNKAILRALVTENLIVDLFGSGTSVFRVNSEKCYNPIHRPKKKKKSTNIHRKSLKYKMRKIVYIHFQI